MNIEQLEKALKEINDTATFLVNENVALKKINKELKERLKKASQLVRSRAYSIYTKKNHEIKVDIQNEKYEELMKYLEG